MTAATDLPDRVDVVIVGGGIQGLCCAYNLAELGDGGVAPPHAAMSALLHACKDRGIGVAYHTSVTGIERLKARVTGVLAGLSMRIEAMALEPVRPLIRPAVALIDSLCYLHQTARGEVVGGTEVPERPRMSLSTDLPVLAATAKVYATMFPRLAQLRVLRHWAGLIHATPDFGPLIGEHPDLKGLWFSAGWSYGYAGGPGAGVLLAKAIVTGEIDDRIKPFALDRFDRECPVHDPAVVLA